MRWSVCAIQWRRRCIVPRATQWHPQSDARALSIRNLLHLIGDGWLHLYSKLRRILSLRFCEKNYLDACTCMCPAWAPLPFSYFTAISVVFFNCNHLGLTRTELYLWLIPTRPFSLTIPRDETGNGGLESWSVGDLSLRAKWGDQKNEKQKIFFNCFAFKYFLIKSFWESPEKTSAPRQSTEIATCQPVGKHGVSSILKNLSEQKFSNFTQPWNNIRRTTWYFRIDL